MKKLLTILMFVPVGLMAQDTIEINSNSPKDNKVNKPTKVETANGIQEVKLLTLGNTGIVVDDNNSNNDGNDLPEIKKETPTTSEPK